MNKERIARQKQLLWVYLRHQGRCTICGDEVNPHEVATDKDIPSSINIDYLLRVRLMHPFCKAAEARGPRRLAA